MPILEAALAGHRQNRLKAAPLQQLQRLLQRRLRRLQPVYQQRPGLASQLVPTLLKPLRQLTALVPGDGDATEASLNILRELNQRPLQQLQEHTQAAPIAAVVVGCRARWALADACRRRFQQAWGLPCLVVTGNPGLADWQWRFHPIQAHLELAGGDHYEHLAAKLLSLALVWGQLRQPPALLKLDDDAAPAGPSQRLLALLAELQARNQQAAGLACHTDPPGQLDRGWHLGKCHSRQANQQAYSGLAPQRWLSGGAGYLLSPAGIQALARHSLIHWGVVESMIYEDVCVSLLLNADAPSHGDPAAIHWLSDPSQLAITNERLQEGGYA